MSSRFVLSSALALVCATGGVTAQVAPPPPVSEPKEEFVPPPMPRPRPAPTREPARPTGPQVTSALPDIPHPPLWSFCGTEDPKVDGICRFAMNLHFAALRPNPTISPGMIPKIQQVIVARRSRFEELVIENLDIAQDIDGGLIASVKISEPESLKDLLDRVKPLTAPTSLTVELENRGILSNTQARFNNKIIGEYQRAYGEYLREAHPENSTDMFMQSMFDDSMIEAMQAYNGMLHESRGAMDKVLAKIDGVPAETAAALRGLALDSIEIDPELITESAEKVKLAWRPLDQETKKAFLSAVREIRENPLVPPVPVINVEHPGKKIIQSDPDSARAIDSSKNIKQMREEEEQAEEQDDG